MAVDQEAKYQAWLADHLDEETAKLDIKEDKESFERMQRMLAGELPMNVPAEFEDIFRQCEEKLAQLKQREPDSL